jgi:hypothetical protein
VAKVWLQSKLMERFGLGDTIIVVFWAMEQRQADRHQEQLLEAEQHGAP